MNEALKEFYQTDTGFEQFVKRHNLVASDPETRRHYYRWLNDIHAQSNVLYGAREEGKAEGRAEKSLEIAKNMKQAGMDTEQIADLTGLSADEIENL